MKNQELVKIQIPEGCTAKIEGNEVRIVKVGNEFRDGDILVSVTNKHRHNTFIYKSTDSRGFHSYYVGIDVCGQLSFSESLSNRWGNGVLYYATDEETQLLFDKMKEKGLLWNAEEKRIEKIRWRARVGEDYFYIDARVGYDVATEEGNDEDEERFNNGNYFDTKKRAAQASAAIKETLKKFHEENC